MAKSWSPLVLIAALAVGVVPMSARVVLSAEHEVTLEQVLQLRGQVERNTVVSKDVRSRVFKYCDNAIDSLQIAADNRAAVDEFERKQLGVDHLVSTVREELERPERRPQLQLPENPTVPQTEDALARERARLAANRAALRDLERLAEDRAKARIDISERLGELDLELELFDDELRAQGDSAARSEIKLAGRLSILARREAAISEIEVLRARLQLLVDRSILIPLEIDLAQRRVSFSEGVVGRLTDAAHEVRAKQAQESLAMIRTNGQRLTEELPELTDLVADTEDLARVLWGSNGLISRSEETVADLVATRGYQSELNRIAELTARKFEAYGRRGSITRWWPKIPKDFPKPGEVARKIQHLDEEIPEVEYQLITFEQERSAAHDLNRRTMHDLETRFGDDLDPELAARVRDLLSTRQDVLDGLISEGGRYSNQLAEYRSVSGKFLGRLREIERFLFAHVLWSRSVPRPIIPQLSTMLEAAGWLLSPDHLRSVSIVGFDIRGDGFFEALLLIVVLLLRQPTRRRLQEIGERISSPERDGFRYTFEALIMTCVLASPLPLALSIAGTVFGRLGDSTYLFSLSAAMSELVLVATLFELIRQIFSPRGLAEAHFGWPAQATRPLYRGLMLTSLIGLPLLYVALHLCFAGVRLDSPDSLQLYNNSLGRVAFIGALTLFGFAILAMLKPEKNPAPSDQDMRVPWPRRFSEYAFPTAFLGAYPIVILATLVPVVLAVFGFYVTALLLAHQMLRTLLLGVVVLVGGGLVHRWHVIAHTRRLRECGEDPATAQKTAGIPETQKQVRQLLRFAIVSVLALGLFNIWSDALPWLQMLKRVQILPRVELLETMDDPTSVLSSVPEVAEAPSTVDGESATDSIPGVPLATGAQGAQTGGTEVEKPLTLWNLLESILAAILTLVLVKNLPGVIEIILRRHTTLDGGARFALSTLVRYSISIVGTIAVFGLLGVTWSKVQWLAAALTFGLGFGLQEIVANFVSGLILLVERPVRVGDVVTIGTLMGKVSRIQIRATTITLWDRSEMIVPNKEFITTKLVNWTLSDSKRRIEIPLRVAYGADLGEVRETLVEIAMQHPSVLDDPAPHALLLSFGEDAIKFELRFVVDFGQGLTTKDQVQMSIESAFREKGIEFALPKSEIRLITGTEKVGERAET